jgi:hypothetical protein
VLLSDGAAAYIGSFVCVDLKAEQSFDVASSARKSAVLRVYPVLSTLHMCLLDSNSEQMAVPSNPRRLLVQTPRTITRKTKAYLFARLKVEAVFSSLS